MTYTRTQATSILRALGFRVRTTGEFTQALSTFQHGYNLGPWLAVDGLCGPATSVALAKCESNRRAGRPTASAHFSWIEWRCTCGGALKGCRLILVRRELLASLEKYRTRVGGPIRIVSGYRCPRRNAAVHGAGDSQHMYGGAVDVDYKLLDTSVIALRAFSGIGRSTSTHRVRHIDRRDAVHNTTGGTVLRPTCWNYTT